MAKKIGSTMRGEFLTKNILFFTPSKKLQCILGIKKGFSIFLTVIERYIKSLYKKIGEKCIQNPLAIRKSSVSLFPTGAFFVTYCK
jgi:hypothetical protein